METEREERERLMRKIRDELEKASERELRIILNFVKGMTN